MQKIVNHKVYADCAIVIGRMFSEIDKLVYLFESPLQTSISRTKPH